MTAAARFARPVRLLVAALALVAGAAAGTAPTSAAAAEDCDGAWVVVDAERLGGDLRTLCAPGSPSSGLEALRLVGVTYSFVERQPGLVCTLDGLPDPCNGAPTDAYWGYWHAEAGGDWTYSTRGAGNRTPPGGSVEGWAFGAGEPPGRRPPANVPAEPDPAPEPEPESSPTATAAPAPKSSTSDDAAEPADGDAGSPDPATDDEPTAASEHADSEPAERPTETVTGPADDAPADDAPADEAEPVVDDEGPPSDPAGDRSGGSEVGDEPDEAAPGSVDDVTAPEKDDTVAVGEVTGDGSSGATAGVVAGSVLIAGLAGAGLLRSRRRGEAGPP